MSEMNVTARLEESWRRQPLRMGVLAQRDAVALQGVNDVLGGSRQVGAADPGA